MADDNNHGVPPMRRVVPLWTRPGDPVVARHNNHHGHTMHAHCWVCRSQGTAYITHPITGRGAHR